MRLKNLLSLSIIYILISINACNNSSSTNVNNEYDTKLSQEQENSLNNGNENIQSENNTIKLNNKDKVILKINDENIFESEFKETKNKYPDFDDKTILEYIITELLVIQQADELNISISDTQVEENINSLKNMSDDFYDKAIEQYGNIENYKKALKNTMIYNEVKNEVLKNFFDKIYLNSESIKLDAQIYIDENGYENISDKEVNEIENKLNENYLNSIGNMYFEVYKYSLMDNAKIKFVDNNYKTILYEPKNIPSEDECLENRLNENYIDINYEDIEYFYKAYFNLNYKALSKDYNINSITSVKLNNYQEKYIDINYVSKQDAKKKIGLGFYLDVRKREHNFSENSTKISINGIEGEINEFSKYIRLSLIDNNLCALVTVTIQSEYCSKDEIIEIAENVIRVNYNK